MCGRYNLITDAEALLDFFEIEQTLLDASELKPRYNISPSQSVPIVRDIGNGRELAIARWGLGSTLVEGRKAEVLHYQCPC